MPRVLLLRHGETEWNRSGRMQGRTDTPLTLEGQRQADAVKGLLAGFQYIFSSPLTRACATAMTIASYNGLPLVVDDRLIERSWGTWEGRLPSEVYRRYSGVCVEGIRPEGYEADDQVLQRCAPFWDEIMAYGDASILAVTHGGFMLALVRELNGDRRSFANLEGQWLHLIDGRLALGDRIAFLPWARRIERKS